jgi:glycosyltransferase involved in cell wall biosynthesis
MWGMNKLSIIIPAFNERECIALLLNRVAAVELVYGLAKEILVVNDGSIDGTDTVVRRFQWGHPHLDVRYLSWPVNRGKGASLQAALGIATGDVIVVQDADLEYDPAAYNSMLQAMRGQQAHVVYGSRFLSGRPVTTRWHRLANRLLTDFSNLCSGLDLTDVHTCLKMFRTELLRSIRLREQGFGFCPEVTLKFAQIPGVRIVEVPVSYHPRGVAQGKKIRVRDGLRAMWCSVKYCPGAALYRLRDRRTLAAV